MGFRRVDSNILAALSNLEERTVPDMLSQSPPIAQSTPSLLKVESPSRPENDAVSATRDDSRFFKRSLAFFSGSVGLGALVICCALIAPAFVAATAAVVFGFLRSWVAFAVAFVFLALALYRMFRNGRRQHTTKENRLMRSHERLASRDGVEN